MSEGRILLVGFGPGAPEHMTHRAREAIAEADVVIGYSTYIKLVQDLLEGKEVIRKGMTEEIDRCEEAYRQARQGKVVALISSGDIGVYGMAGPTYEVLLQAGWTPDSEVSVEVIPGATALNACAALVGAPLTHDFCSISLSDLLTPWPVIARRLEAAARGDFVVALYNPKSGRRTRQIREAQRILMQHRQPDTPVAIVKSAYRRRQTIQITTLDAMADCDIGMLCTVLIGNRSTFMREGLMITPRGYANKYDALTGRAHEGEQAGRSLTMGLSGWHGVVRAWLAEETGRTLRDAALHFETSLSEILQAVHGAGKDSSLISDRRAAPAPVEMLDRLLEQAVGWGRLRAVVRSGQGAVAELLIRLGDTTRRGSWLNFISDDFHLHLDLQQVAALWFYSQTDRQHGVYCLDADGNSLLTLLLIRQNDDFSASELSLFQEAFDAYGEPHTPETDENASEEGVSNE